MCSRPWSRSPFWASWCCCTRAWRPACHSPTLTLGLARQPRRACCRACRCAAVARGAGAGSALGGQPRAAASEGCGGAPGHCGACCGITGQWPAVRVRLLRACTALRLPSHRSGVRCIGAALPAAGLALCSGASPGWRVAGCEHFGCVWCTDALLPERRGCHAVDCSEACILGSCAGT